MGKIRKGAYVVDTDRKRLDAAAVKDFLNKTYWAKGRGLAAVKKSLKHSLCFGLYFGREQVGLARVITDYTTFAYLCDVYVREDHQGKGLGKFLVSCVLKSRELKDLRGMSLRTRDAHGLYRRFGFKTDRLSDRWMRLRRRPAAANR